MIYFAYGADLSPTQLDARVPGYRPLGAARLTGHKLVFPRFAREWRGATASLAPSANDTVFGALYDLPPDDVPVLHRHKGYDPESPPELNEHVFREVTVRRLATGEALSAWTYLAVPDNTTARPSAAYINAILDGARRHGLPRAYVLLLQGIKTG
jgi:AIG2-like family